MSIRSDVALSPLATFRRLWHDLDVFVNLGVEGLRRFANDRAIIYDIKGILP